VRLWLVPGLVVACACAHADRLIFVPVGEKIPFRSARAEWFAPLAGTSFSESRLHLGVHPQFDATIRGLTYQDGPFRSTFDLSYNQVPPFPGVAPGISLGVLDTLNVTRTGRQFYMAVTIREDFETVDGDALGDVTFGVFVGERTMPFGGLSIPFSRRIRWLVEHDGRQIATGLEYRPRTPLRLRLVFREGSTLGSLGYGWSF
jgi:hypothetical protein